MAIDCVINEKMEEEEDRAKLVAKEMTDAELDEAHILEAREGDDYTDEDLEDEESYQKAFDRIHIKIPMRQRVAEVDPNKDAELLASTIFFE